MKITTEAWIALANNVNIQGQGIDQKSTSLRWNPEVSAKNGGTEALLGMIIELESTLRVLKRRLQESLPSHNGCCSNSETHKEGNRIHCSTCGGIIESPIVTKTEIVESVAKELGIEVHYSGNRGNRDYLQAAISKELDKHYPIPSSNGTGLHHDPNYGNVCQIFQCNGYALDGEMYCGKHHK